MLHNVYRQDVSGAGLPSPVIEPYSLYNKDIVFQTHDLINLTSILQEWHFDSKEQLQSMVTLLVDTVRSSRTAHAVGVKIFMSSTAGVTATQEARNGIFKLIVSDCLDSDLGCMVNSYNIFHMPNTLTVCKRMKADEGKNYCPESWSHDKPFDKDLQNAQEAFISFASRMRILYFSNAIASKAMNLKCLSLDRNRSATTHEGLLQCNRKRFSAAVQLYLNINQIGVKG